jgi:hypothetical protein
MKRNNKTPKLSLSTSTVRQLAATEIQLVAGGFSSDTIYNTCRYGGGCNSGSAYGGNSGNYICQ